MTNCQFGCKNLETRCVECKRLACSATLPKSEWIPFDKSIFTYTDKRVAPFDSKPFLACIWGEWVGQAIYARHYGAGEDRPPSKYDFFYVTMNPEDEGWKIRIEDDPFPITHWMPLPTYETM